MDEDCYSKAWITTCHNCHESGDVVKARRIAIGSHWMG